MKATPPHRPQRPSATFCTSRPFPRLARRQRSPTTTRPRLKVLSSGSFQKIGQIRPLCWSFHGQPPKTSDVPRGALYSSQAGRRPNHPLATKLGSNLPLRYSDRIDPAWGSASVDDNQCQEVGGQLHVPHDIYTTHPSPNTFHRTESCKLKLYL
jgi:hypothetical protein